MLLLPFVVLLALIALGPLVFPDWWSRNYAKVSLGLGLGVATYYLLMQRESEVVLQTASEYCSFIVLIGALFVIAGGIHLTVKGQATPLENITFLAIGAVVANLLGTTGASMLLIRPWLKMNHYRCTGYHVVFFIFIISNVGGCLTPIGDPPLYLGYLNGVPFLWITARIWPIWLAAMGMLLSIFYVIDSKNYRRAPAEVRHRVAEPHDEWHFEGLPNLLCLAAVIGMVVAPIAGWLKQLMILTIAAGSYFLTPKRIHEHNHFSFGPIKEVAILFIGIFMTMIPALELLAHLGLGTNQSCAGLFYWGSGVLSSVLDNAPTYLAFLKAATGSFADPHAIDQIMSLLAGQGAGSLPVPDVVRNTLQFIQTQHMVSSGAWTREKVEVAYLLAQKGLASTIVSISVGSVFFGANTYIGNGPNFLVKAIADHQKIHTPDFLTYILKYTLPFMLPMLIVIWMIFVR